MEKKVFERPIIKKLSAGMPAKFGHQVRHEPVTQIDGVPIKNLLEIYGSPLFVYSEKTIRQTFKEAYRAFSSRYPNVLFAWSYKTNYLNAVCNVFHQEGAWAEVVSGFEYQKALANGVSGDKIIFNGPDKSKDDLELAVQNQSLIHIDHFDELYDLIEISENSNIKPKVAVRVNMDTGIYPAWDRFGFNFENGEAWDALNRIMHADKLELLGLHTHIGTYIMGTEPYKIAASKLAELAIGLSGKFDHQLQYIDIGGGFASKNTLKGVYYPGTDTTPSFEDYADAITSVLIKANFRHNKLPLLILETGRALIDDAGSLAGTVIATKRLANGQRATILDAGVNLLFTSFWYDHDIRPAKPMSDQTEETAFFGPLCMNIDVIRKNMLYPLLKKGDPYLVQRVGAYNNTQWLQFITLRPNVVMIDGKGETHLIRKKETLKTLNEMESVPDHLTS
jgi:diaminopimelate decarboxylase